MFGDEVIFMFEVMFMFMFMPILCAETVEIAPRASSDIPFEMCILELVFVCLEKMGWR